MGAPLTVVGKDQKDVELGPMTQHQMEEGRWRLAALGIVICLFHIIATYPLPESLVFKGPVNRPYHRMRLTGFFGFGFPFLLQWHGRTSLRLQPVLFMVIMWLLIQSVLLAITGLWLQLGLALALLSAVIALAWPLRSLDWARDYVHTAYGHLGQGPCGLKIYTVVFSLLPFGFIMPIFGPWERVQLWVRWHPYNLDAELLWRGTFATFACALFLTAANPKVNNSIVAFFAAHGVCHSVSMFIDNRVFPMDGNDNVEHLLEISLFMILGLIHTFVGRAVWF